MLQELTLKVKKSIHGKKGYVVRSVSFLNVFKRKRY